MATKEVVSIVFTDIEHSTRLAQHLKEGYAELLRNHRAVIRGAIATYQGKEMDVAGDGFFITFKEPQNAVLAAAEIQQRFYTIPWAREVGLKVRIGIHTGVALCSKEGCTGVEVHLGARICHAAYGGQVLVSNATRQLLGKVREGLSLDNLGSFKFRDFANPIALFQLNIAGLESSFPAPRIENTDARIAVLPFSNLTGDIENQYVGEGIAEELIVALGKVKGIRVISRSAAFAMAQDSSDIDIISEILNAPLIMNGTVRTHGNRFRVGCELVDAENGTNLWSGTFDSDQDELLAIAEKIAQRVTDVLELTFTPEQFEAMHERQSHNPEAYDFYLRGRRFYWQFSSTRMELAVTMFKKAIEADKNYALAYAGLSDAYSYQYQHVDGDHETLGKADLASQRALELAPTLAEGAVSRGIVLALQGDTHTADRCFQTAIENDPTLFLGWFHYARMCFTTGRLEKAARLFEQAHRVEPEDYQSVLLAAQSYSDLGNDKLARSLRTKGIQLADRMLAINPGDTRALYMAANTLAIMNERSKALEYAKMALMLEPDDSMLLYNIGCVYALLGMEDEALTCLENSFKAGLTLRGWYENDSNLDSVRSCQRFKALMAKMSPQPAD